MWISGPVYSSHQDLPYYPGTLLRIYVFVPFQGACALLCTHEDDHTSVRMYWVWLSAWDDVCPQITGTIVDEEHRGGAVAPPCVTLVLYVFVPLAQAYTRTCPSCGCFHVSTSALSAEAVVLVTRAALETIPDLGTSMESNSPGFHIVASMNKVFPTKIPQQRNE